jgi:mannose-6-phosphate isomerase-like protein (cupin superfamily)
MSTSLSKHRTSLPPGVIFLPAGQGRAYAMGRMNAVFMADGSETNERYSVSVWWVEGHSGGPGAHLHESNDEIFYVIEGTASLLIGDAWIDAAAGSFIRIPAGIMHDFKNRTDDRIGLLNVFIPGGFEKKMPAIVEWFTSDRTGLK